MAPLEPLKLPETIKEIPIVGGRGIYIPKASDLAVSEGPKIVRPQDVAPDGRLKNRNPKEYWPGREVFSQDGKPLVVTPVGEDLYVVPINETMKVDPSTRPTNVHVMSLGQKPKAAEAETRPIRVTPAEIEDAKTDVFVIGLVEGAQAIYEYFGQEFSPTIKQNIAFHELQLGLRPGELENSPIGLTELAQRRAQVKHLTRDANSIVGDVYAGRDVKAPEGMRPEAIYEISDWAQRGKELGMPQDMVIEVAVTHISRTLEGSSPTKEHKNTLRDITDTVELARGKEQGKREPSAAEKKNEVAEKRAAFLASMDPKIAKYYLEAKNDQGEPLFTSQEVFLYEQYSVLRIFLENGGTPDPKTILQNSQERDAFLSVVLPGSVQSETEAQKIISNAIVEFLTIYSDKSDKEAKKIIADELGEVQFLAREAAGMISDADVHPVEEGVIELKDEDLIYEAALSMVVGPVLAEEIMDTGVYLRDTDPTTEFQIGGFTDPDLDVTRVWKKEKAEFMDDLSKTQRWQRPVIELDTADLMDVRPAATGDLVDRKGQQYSISQPRIFTDVVKLEPGQVTARIEGPVNGGVWKDFNDGRGRQRAVKVNFSIEEHQKIRNGQVQMVEGRLTVWMTPEKAKEMGIIPVNHNNYWVLSELK